MISKHEGSLISLLLILSLCLFSGCAKHAQEEQASPLLILRYADNQPEQHPATKAAKRFAKLVEERTGGKIAIAVYANGELGDEKGVLEQIQFGGIDFSRFSLGTLSDSTPIYCLLELPYLYRDSAHMWRVLDSDIGDMFLQKMEDKGVVGLAWFDAGVRNIYTTTKVNTLEDLKGMTIRVQESDFMSQMIQCLGVSSVQIPYGLVYSALQLKKIDGAENNLPSYQTKGHYAVAPFMLLDEHIRIPEIVVMSAPAKEKILAIDPSLLDVVKECAKECARYERTLWQEEEMKDKALLQGEGCVMTSLSDEELAKFKDAMKPLTKQYQEQYGDLLDRIEKL